MVKLTILLLAIAWSATGCEGCESERTVPFKREQTAEPAPPVPPPAADAGLPTPPDFAPIQGAMHGPGTTEIQVANQSLSRKEGSFRASLAVRLDADARPDALAVAQDAAGAPHIEYALASDAGFQELSTSPLELPLGCELQTVRLSLISQHHALATAQVTCDGLSQTDAGAGEPGEPASEAKVQAHLWVIAVEPAPRVLEHLARAVGDGVFTLSVASEDRDKDGHSDLVAEITVRPAHDVQPTAITLVWLNRAGGLARDQSEPEKTMLALANEARVALKRAPNTALPLAMRVIHLHELLCRESGKARLGVGNSRGLRCERSTAAGRATAVSAVALARKGRILEALAATKSLAGPGLRVVDSDRQRAQTALEEITRIEGLNWIEGPAVTRSRLPLHQPTVGFLEEQRLLIRGEPARAFDLSMLTIEPLANSSSQLWTNPAGTLAAVEIFRSCQGYHLRLVKPDQVSQGLVLGKSLAEPLIASAPPPPGAKCVDGTLPAGQRNYDGGYLLLTWGPGGLLLAQGAQRQLLVIDDQGRANAPASDVDDLTRVPPHSPGVLSRSGAHYALVSQLGVVIVEPGKPSRLVPLLEQGHGEITEVALSPSGKSLAVVRSGKLYVANLSAVPPTPADPEAGLAKPTEQDSTPVRGATNSRTPYVAPTP